MYIIEQTETSRKDKKRKRRKQINKQRHEIKASKKKAMKQYNHEQEQKYMWDIIKERITKMFFFQK